MRKKTVDNQMAAHTTIGLKKTTKDRLDHFRAPGQCYDGFICQLVDLWEDARGNGNGNGHAAAADEKRAAGRRAAHA